MVYRIIENIPLVASLVRYVRDIDIFLLAYREAGLNRSERLDPTGRQKSPWYTV